MITKTSSCDPFDGNGRQCTEAGIIEAEVYLGDGRTVCWYMTLEVER